MDTPADRLETEWGLVIADFTVQQVPRGFAPEDIREQWVGVRLPVRLWAVMWHMKTAYPAFIDGPTGSLIQNEQPIPVVTEDAQAVLDAAGKKDAASFWRTTTSIGPLLVFEASAGTVEPRPGFGKRLAG